MKTIAAFAFTFIKSNKKLKAMKRLWNFRNKEYIMTFKSYGNYSLNGYHCTDSYIWDHVNNDENLKKRGEARRAAELFVKRHQV